MPVAIQLGMFACPVIYSVSAIPAHLRRWYLLNPMAVVIDSFRQVVFQTQFSPSHYLWVGTGIAAACAVLSYTLFKRVEVQFSDAI